MLIPHKLSSAQIILFPKSSSAFWLGLNFNAINLKFLYRLQVTQLSTTHKNVRLIAQKLPKFKRILQEHIVESYEFVLFCLFWLAFLCFGSIETQKLAVSVKNQNNQNKRFVLDSAETSFGSSFSCFESKLVSLDTLVGSSHRCNYSSGWARTLGCMPALV